jgi:hypothetical protein
MKTEVIDRSNDKMTIRATVEKRVEAQTRPEIHPNPQAPEKKVNDREIEELKDLKKELQELKAMKEDMKNNPDADPVDPNEPESDQHYIPNEDPNLRGNTPNNGVPVPAN